MSKKGHPLRESTGDNENEIIALNLQREKSILRNNFQFMMYLYFIMMTAFFFSISFYRWFNLHIQNPNTTQTQSIWVNMLYVRNAIGHYVLIKSYRENNEYCSNFQISSEKQTICENTFQDLQYLGYVCISLYGISLILQVLDFIRINQLRKQNRNKFPLKAACVHPTIILFDVTATAFYFFYIVFMSGELQFQIQDFGASFITCSCCIPTFIGLAIYYRATQQKLLQVERRAKLLQELEQQEQNLLD